jgi:hypothetical protein
LKGSFFLTNGGQDEADDNQGGGIGGSYGGAARQL